MFTLYTDDLNIEFQQSIDQGRDVSGLEKMLREINAATDMSEKQRLGQQFYTIIENRPTMSGYPYHEPSEYDAILAARPTERPILSAVSSNLDKIKGAWFGRCAGCLLGKPVEGARKADILSRAKAMDNYPITRYFSDDINCMPNDDDTNYTMIGLFLLEKYGLGFTTSDVANTWLSRLPAYSTFTAERAAYRNVLCGVPAEQVATTYNPYREWIGAQIRADIFGYVCPGNPEKAAALAYKDASLSHIKNGIYGEMFVAAMLSAAAVTDDFSEIVSAGLSEIPQNSRLRREIDYILELCRANDDYNVPICEIHKRYPEGNPHNTVHTISNAMIVVTALYYGKMDLTKTIGIAVEAGMDTDCNGATSGSIVGMAIGFKKLPESYVKPLCDTMHTELLGFDGISITELADRTYSLIIKDKTNE